MNQELKFWNPETGKSLLSMLTEYSRETKPLLVLFSTCYCTLKQMFRNILHALSRSMKISFSSALLCDEHYSEAVLTLVHTDENELRNSAVYFKVFCYSLITASVIRSVIERPGISLPTFLLISGRTRLINISTKRDESK